MKRTGTLVAGPLVLILGVLVSGQNFLAPANQDTPGFAVQDATPEVRIPGGPGGGAARPLGTLPGNPSIQLVKMADGLIDPVTVAAPNDGSGRLYIVERVGHIRILEQDGTLIEEPFLNIAEDVKFDFFEQGLLGLAFHPDYQNTGRFYVLYADWATSGDPFVVEYKVSADNPNAADPDSARLVLAFSDDPYVSHNGGTLRFGPDGYLYISMGDGGFEGDPYENAQDLSSLFGKILRIDVDAATEQHPYAIPDDNPYAARGSVNPGQWAIRPPDRYYPDARPEIWARGLRNPWQFSFDPENGDLYLTDVGENAWEEINYQAAGKEGGQNYGWDWLEGTHCYPTRIMNCPRQQLGVLPVAEYSHAEGDCAITGMGVYRGEESPALDGIYFNSDFCSGRVWGLTRDDTRTWVYQQLLDTTLLVTGGGQDEAGEVYLTACECLFERDYDPFENPTGTLWRVVSADRVPERAETAPLEQPDGPEATPAPEGDEALSTEADVLFSRVKEVKHDMLAGLTAGSVELTLSLPYSALDTARDRVIYPWNQGPRTGALIAGPAAVTTDMLSIRQHDSVFIGFWPPVSGEGLTLSVSFKEEDGSVTALWTEHIPAANFTPEAYRAQLVSLSPVAGRKGRISVDVSPAPTSNADGDRFFVGHLAVVSLSVARDRALTVTSVNPDRVEASVVFGVQPDESSVISVTGDGFTPDVQILIDGRPIPTNFETATLLTGTVPGELLAELGDKELVVQRLDRRSNTLIWSVTSVRSNLGGTPVLPDSDN